MIRNKHAVNGIMHRKIIQRVLQQTDTAIACVTNSERGFERHLSFKREIPLLRVGHFQAGIDLRNCVTRCLRARYKNKSIRWVSKIDWIEPCTGNCLVDEQSVRRIESHRCATLREYRLKDASVIDTVAAAN